MSGLADLRTVKHPKSGTRVCAACKAFAAECMVPHGEGSLSMCWLCAHHVVDHDVPLARAMEARCECAPEDIYPVRVLKARTAAYEIAKGNGFEPLNVRRDRC